MKVVEHIIEQAILGSRWVLVVFYGGLAASLVVYGFSFILKFLKMTGHVFDYSGEEMILAMLNLIDAALVASLTVMVMLAGYENFVSRIDTNRSDLSWLGKLDAGTLKVKVAVSIVAISSIHLLTVFMNVDQYTNDQLLWSTVIHLTFLVSALLLAHLDKMIGHAADH